MWQSCHPIRFGVSMLFRAFLALVVVSSSACASMGTRDALVSDRPDFTERASTIAPRHVQVEAGQTTSREGEARVNAVGEVLVRAGLTPRLELRVSGNSWVQERVAGTVNSGLEDGAIGIKYNVTEGPDEPSWRPTFSVIAHTTVPTGSDAFRVSRAQPEVKLLGAWTLSDRLGFSSN
ncbi:MAG TPA: transporter [Gemmatimonas aurantiaca]|nr:transporter [Gemmatimonas aurantiaca]